MFQITRKQIRPNTSVEYVSFNSAWVDPSVRDYIDLNYKETGKVVSTHKTDSPDDLERTIQTIYSDIQAAREWSDDHFLTVNFHSPAFQYMANNNMQLIIVSSTPV